MCLFPLQSTAYTENPTAWHACDKPAEPQKNSIATPACARRVASEHGFFALGLAAGSVCVLEHFSATAGEATSLNAVGT